MKKQHRVFSEKEQITRHSILIQMNDSYEWFRHKDCKAVNMPWLAITKLYPVYTKKCHSLFKLLCADHHLNANERSYILCTGAY